jgi:hypothetical protein
VLEEITSPYGVKYIIEGIIVSPIGVTLHLRTIWIIEGNDAPRFVTAYPAKTEV